MDIGIILYYMIKLKLHEDNMWNDDGRFRYVMFSTSYDIIRHEHIDMP
ncbi:unnamed protein product [marine sediment metagenome]|uniref:Uncharacterized protein n=1 Tax=marine sediment metagenome TaxID=412755 RepID=X0VN65_9ZZZZ